LSAICGLYFKNTQIDPGAGEAVMKELGKYQFDKSATISQDPVFFGCHLNWVTPESVHEILPFADDQAQLMITADAIIDNREELCELLSVSDGNITDSLLILKAYQKWGVKCPEYLVGDFAFAIWDKQKETLFCARDHMGNRVLHYHNSPDLFIFATLIEPLFQAGGIKRRLNETYIADFLSIATILPALVDDLTIYEGVFQLPAACAILVTGSGSKVWRYWEPQKTKEIHFDTDAEYEAAFREIYFEAVRCRLRSIKKVGVMLSGGLDSGSVACVAAAELKKRGEKLYSFTQVPMADYRDWLPQGKLADEREYVEANCRFAGNIESYFIASEGKSPLTEIDHMMGIFEHPYKNFGNLHWISGINQAAAKMGIGVMLNGQFGNATVSWGRFHPYMKYLIKTGRLQTFFKEIKAYAVRNKTRPASLFLQTVYWCFAPRRIKKYRYRKKGGMDSVEMLSPINPEFYRTMRAGRRLKKHGEDPLFLAVRDSVATRMRMLGPVLSSQAGSIWTKMALSFDVEMRDPTSDKRLVEFCLNLPENQWVRDGEERRFIRYALKGYMPDQVRLNTMVRGRQAADWMQRIKPEWAAACQEMETIGVGPLERKYLDIVKIKRFLAENQELKFGDNDGINTGVSLLIRALVFTRFLRSLEF
jgi:asparagine synthase (glutamine-hydrolysing)